jgi:Amt family ammonium transporter
MGTAICMLAILLIPLAGAGLALINTGLGRSRSAAHTMLAALSVMATAVLAYGVCGFAWQSMAGRAAHTFVLAGQPWNWLGRDAFFLRGVTADRSLVIMLVCLQLFSAGLAALIPLGSGADRWRLGASCASSALLAGWTYPLFAHWVWGGGWLAQLGTNFGLGQGMIDAGGAGTVQAVGGLSALAMTWILGPRLGRYEHGGFLAAIPGHNAVLALFGCMLALAGWSGLGVASAILFYGVGLKAVPLIVANYLLAAGAALLAVVMLTRARFGKPDASLSGNGWIAGLVAVSASGPFVAPAAAVLIGAIAGLMVPFAVEWLDRLSVDDPGGAITVHAVGGIWGLLAVGIFARLPRFQNGGAGSSGQWLAQLAGVATLLGLILPMTYLLNWLLDRFWKQRVPPDGERQGMDLYELGAGAYPELTLSNE